MFSKQYTLLIIICLSLFSCTKSQEDNFVNWGKVNYYNKFLWKKYVPDTLYRDLVFDFNEDAKNFMERPLKIGLFKKSDNGKMVLVKDDEMYLYIDGKQCLENIVEVSADCEKVRIGIIFANGAENKVHHWYFRPIDDAGLDRINDLASDQFNAANSSLLGIDVEKNKITNPLQQTLHIILICIIALFILWLLFLKRMFFPYFGVGRMILLDPEPYLKTINLRKYRKFVLTNKILKQSWFSTFFTGKVGYDINSLWDSDIVFLPKDRKSIRIYADNEKFYTGGRTLKVGNSYTIENLGTTAKTKIEL